MPIGDSQGNYHDDEFQQLAAPYLNGEDSDTKAPLSTKDLPDFTNQYGTPDANKMWFERAADSFIDAIKYPGDVMSGNKQLTMGGIANMAVNLMGAPAAVAERATAGEFGSFAGVRSKTIDKGALQTAQDAIAQGVHPDDVWQQTGFFQGADGRWRYEIPDNNAKLNEEGFNKTVLSDNGGGDTLFSVKPPSKDFFGGPIKGGLDIRLSDVLDHPDLYQAYPNLANIKVRPFPDEKMGKDLFGMMSPSENTMYLADDLHPDFIRSVLLHEAQHAIQATEGFARGGSSSEFSENALENYKRLAGEVEARNVQTRMDWNDVKRYFNSPRSSEDRPRFIQNIVDQRTPKK